MNTQNTPLHVSRWTRGFWLMAMANLLLALSVTMLIPTLPQWLLQQEHLNRADTGLAMALFGLGLFIPGAFCSFLVQRYRRNIVFMVCVQLLAITMLVPWRFALLPEWAIFLWRLLQGGLFGLAQLVLASTLIIDTCESHWRTEGNFSATWFGRLALTLGPVAGLLTVQAFGFVGVGIASAVSCLMSVLLIMFIHFPFRVPEDHVHVVSLDRFFLTEGFPLFFHLLVLTVPVGMLLALPLDSRIYALMALGFFLALLAQRFVFPDADLKSEVVSGLLLMAASMLIMLAAPFSEFYAPLFGIGIGLVSMRFLLFFIKLSHHCQRGTAQSTFLLAWEGGLALGIGLGYACFAADQQQQLLITAIILTAVSMAVYVVFTHQWFLRHKNR